MIVSKQITDLSGHGRWADLFAPIPDLTRAISDLRADLMDVPVMTAAGKVTNIFYKLESESGLSRQDKDAVWHCLALVRDNYLRLEALDKESPSTGYQQMNWKHTRAELDQVLDAALVLRLSPAETRDALIASIFSDAVKDRKNFIIHNIHGAEAAVQALSLVWDLSQPQHMAAAERINLAIKQHQVAPPEFMARTVALMLCRKLGVDSFDSFSRTGLMNFDVDGKRVPRVKHTILSIYSKIKNPYNRGYLTADLGRIDFTPEEREYLQMIDIEDWYVPHPDVPGSRIAHALIAGDHSINYNNPDGFAKIALIRGPNTESYFEDATIYDSLESAMASFADSFDLLLPEVKPMALRGIRRTHAAVQRVLCIMTELLSGITVGPREESHNLTGQDRIDQACSRAREKHAELFAQTSACSSEAGLKYFERSKARVGVMLQEWYQEYGGIPFRPAEHGLVEPGPGKLPFWNVPLKYPKDKNGLASLTVLEQTQFAFAICIREIAVELLRAEQWFY